MRRAIVVLALTVVGGAGPALAQDAIAEKEIRRIVGVHATTWDAGDGTAYAVTWRPKPPFTILFGMVMYGAGLRRAPPPDPGHVLQAHHNVDVKPVN